MHSDPTWAKANGYIVLPDADPTEVPVKHFARGLILLDTEGTWRTT